MKTTTLLTTLAVLIALGVSPALAADSAEKPKKFKGEVIQVTQRTGTETANAGQFDSIRIRTQEGEEQRLVLGEAGSSAGRFQVGDQVQGRTSAGGLDENGYRVRTMKLQRTGESFQYRNKAGELMQGNGKTTRNRSQTRDPARKGQNGNSRVQGGGTGGHGHGGGGRR